VSSGRGQRGRERVNDITFKPITYSGKAVFVITGCETGIEYVKVNRIKQDAGRLDGDAAPLHGVPVYLKETVEGALVRLQPRLCRSSMLADVSQSFSLLKSSLHHLKRYPTGARRDRKSVSKGRPFTVTVPANITW